MIKTKWSLTQRLRFAVVVAAKIFAGIAQLVERNLAKVEVASSSLVSRSNPEKGY